MLLGQVVNTHGKPHGDRKAAQTRQSIYASLYSPALTVSAGRSFCFSWVLNSIASVVICACCEHHRSQRVRTDGLEKKSRERTMIVCPSAALSLGSHLSGKRSSASHTRRSSTLPPKPVYSNA